MTTGLPFDDFRALLARLPHFDRQAAGRVKARSARFPGEAGAFGRLDRIVEWLAGSSGRAPPTAARPLVALFAGAHALEERLEAFSPAALAAAFVERSGKGQAAVNQVCAAHDLGLKVFDLALDLPAADITLAPALDEKACAATMAFGMEAIAGGADLVCLGAVGADNRTVVAALLTALFGGEPEDWLGDKASPARIAAVREATALHQAASSDPLEALRRLGGRESAALAGAILAARVERIPVILDGYAATAAAAVLWKAAPQALDHCLLAQLSPAPGHERLAGLLGLEPLLDLGVADGEGLAAALAAGLVKTAVSVHTGLAAAALAR